MPPITTPVHREIIDDFALEIERKQLKTAKPKYTVINFRTDIQDGKEREIVKVPIHLLRYRKDNGRISSDVFDYVKRIGPLDEKDEDAQKQIREFLEQKDPEKTHALRMSIIHGGQREPAIVTCDGFLINGNRRKMVMEKLHKEHPHDEKYAYMKAVILPGKNDEGGPPTLIEIEKIESRYQLQSDGKSEYYGFDRALSIKRKLDLGFSLEEQLKDDPIYAEATKAQLKTAVKKLKKEFLNPLLCIDRYLKQFRREGQYKTISSGKGDPEGRWEAFKDYSDVHTNCFSNPNRRIALDIDEEDIGTFEEAAFNIIRLRLVPDMPKVHTIMRNLPKFLDTKEGKKAIKKLTDDVDPVLPKEECYDDKGDALSYEEIDEKWVAKNKQSITYNLKKSAQEYESKREKETPLQLLEVAYQKLTHDNMDMTAILINDQDRARKLAVKIKNRAEDIEKEIYQFQKEQKKLRKKHAS